MSQRPPLPPFTEETARQKVQAAEDAWNTKDPERVAGAYSEDSVWRNRHEFITGRAAIAEFLRRKWDRELDYALRKDLWAFEGNRITTTSMCSTSATLGQSRTTCTQRSLNGLAIFSRYSVSCQTVSKMIGSKPS